MRPMFLMALPLLVGIGCGGRMAQPPVDEADAKARQAPVVRTDVWKGPLPPIPTQVSPRLEPGQILATTRLDRKSAHRRLGELSLAALAVIEQMAFVGEQARDVATLCREVGPDVTTAVVDRLASSAWKLLGQVKPGGRVQAPYDHLAQCLRYAGEATRARILPALLARAAQEKDLSIFSFAFHGARYALALLTPAQVEPILRLAQRLLPRAREYYHKEHLLAGMAAAGTVLPPARAQALLARAQQGVLGAAHKDSREVFLGELALLWVELARRNPELSDRVARSILRLAATPFAKAQALGKLVELPGFVGSKGALTVLKTLRLAATKLPVTEQGWLQERLVAQAAKVAGGLPLLRQVVNDADKQHAVRVRIAATKALASEHAAEAVVYAGEALDRIDKMTREASRNWRQAPLLRALDKLDAKARQPLLARMEKRALGFKDPYFTVWTLRRLMELQRAANPAEARRLAARMMRAVQAIPEAARRARALRGIFKLGLESGPAAASVVIAQALKLTGQGVGAWVWERFLRPLGKHPLAVRKRWTPPLLGNIVRQAATWRPDDIARFSRQVAKLAPEVMAPREAEALLLKVWAAVESADKRASDVQLTQVVNGLRAVGRGLAALGSMHFPTLMRRMEALIPRDKAWSEHLMSYVASLGALLPAADAAQLRARLEAWTKQGDPQRDLMRRGAIVAGLVASHGKLDRAAVAFWLGKGPARLSYTPMVQFLIRLPLADLQTKAAALPSLGERARMYRVLIRATAERAKREPGWRRRRARRNRPRGR